MTTAVFYEANAGTGKTYTLTQYILDALQKGIGIDRICALTFTEKAANEMMERLRGKLAELIQKGEHPPSQMQLADRCFVGTIHAFCLQILKRYVDRTDLPPLFEIDPRKEIFNRMFEARWDQFISQILRHPTDSDALLIRRLGISTLRKLADLLVETQHRFPSSVDHSSEWLRQDLTNARKWKFNPLGDTWVNAAVNALDEIDQFRDVLAVMVEAGKLKDEFGRAVKDFVRCKSEELHLAIGMLTEKFLRPFRREYHAAGYVAYEDLLVHARDLLRDKRIRAQQKAKYDLVLVDEMQDTDALQYEIILYLSEKKDVHEDFTLRELLTGAKQLQLQPGKLFVVGDPKQSIYSFRNADLNAYQTVKEVLRRSEAELKPLTTNRRSCTNLVDFTNLLAKDLFPGSNPEDSDSANPDYCEGKLIADCVQLIQITAPDTSRVHLRILSEANWLTRKIKQLTQLQQYRYQEIGILLRKLTSAHIYVDAFGAQGIPVVVEGEKAFFRSQEIIDFINLLKYITDPLDKIALAGLLRSPLFGLTDYELAHFFINYRKQKVGGPAYLAAIEALTASQIDGATSRSATLKDFLERIERIRTGARQYTPGRLVDEVLNQLPVLAVAGIAYGSYRRDLAPLNILKIHKQAVEADADPSMSMHRFVTTLEKYSKEGKEFPQEPLADEGVNAVRIMSIHMSKGLDFAVVFVPLTDFQTPGAGPQNEIVYDWETDTVGVKANYATDANYLRYMHGLNRPWAEAKAGFGKLEEEERRVLYVAATRAKHRLYFCCVTDGSGKETFKALNRVHPLVKIQEEESDSSFDETEPSTSPPAVSIDAIVEAWEKVAAARNRATLPVITSMTEEVKRELEDEVAEFQPRFDVPEDGGLIGSICHGVLERIDFKDPKDWKRLLEIEKCKYYDDFTPNQIEKAATTSDKILDNFFGSEAARWLASVEIVGREVPVVAFEREKNRVLSGKIDLLVKEGDKYYVIDHKTDTKLRKESLHQYRRQTQLYAQSVSSTLGSSPTPLLCLVRSGKLVPVD